MTSRGPTVVITMAGAGKRFRDAGYDRPKFAIEVAGRTIFSWALESLRSFYARESQWVFVTRAEDDARDFVAVECARLGIGAADVVPLAVMTDGQATTALQAEPCIRDREAPLLIYNIDTYVEPQFLPADGPRGEGWIPCFPGVGDAWSFAKADDTGAVVEVREKRRISPHATIGLYWFSTFSLYRDAYARYYGTPSRIEAGERYVAPLYNQLIADGHRVYIHSVPAAAVHALGTPAEVQAFAKGGGRPRP